MQALSSRYLSALILGASGPTIGPASRRCGAVSAGALPRLRGAVSAGALPRLRGAVSAGALPRRRCRLPRRRGADNNTATVGAELEESPLRFVPLTEGLGGDYCQVSEVRFPPVAHFLLVHVYER